MYVCMYLRMYVSMYESMYVCMYVYICIYLSSLKVPEIGPIEVTLGWGIPAYFSVRFSFSVSETIPRHCPSLYSLQKDF